MSARKDKPKIQPASTIGKFRSLLKSLFAVSKAELTEALEAEKSEKPSAEEPDAD
jgi:hypothetical protein